MCVCVAWSWVTCVCACVCGACEWDCQRLLRPGGYRLLVCGHVCQSVSTFVCVRVCHCECECVSTAVFVKAPLQLKWKCMQWPTPKWVPFYPAGHILWGIANKPVCVCVCVCVCVSLLGIHLSTELQRTLLIGLVAHRVLVCTFVCVTAQMTLSTVCVHACVCV